MKDTTKAAFVEHGLAEFPKEACGLIVVRKGKEVYVPCGNDAADPQRHFRIPAADYANAEDSGDIVAVAHTHPNETAKPSVADRAACEESGLPWYILSITQDLDDPPVVGNMERIEPCGYVAPLVGRTFVHGVHDCYSIIRDWYKQERGVTLPNYHRDDEWWQNGGNLYVENFRDAGFTEAKGEPLEGDVILMQVRSSVPNHAAIYLGDGTFLHHMHSRLSTREVYGGYWSEVTVKFLRREETDADAG